MTGYYERRKSRAAEWCLRLALICVPYFLLTILFHRSQAITTEQAFWLIAFGIVMLSASLLLGIRAVADLWEKGYKGGRATVKGTILSVLMIIPLGIQLGYALENPQLNDVATNVFDPPVFLEGEELKSDAGENAYDSYRIRQIVSAYPELVSRRYQAPPERVAEGVTALLGRWNWPVTASRNLEELLGGNPTQTDDLAGDEGEIRQVGEGEADALPRIAIQSRARSMIMKLPSDIVIRLTPEGETTLVDMRSASRWGPHDFGANARFINQFLAGLDEELAGIAGE